MKNIKLKFVHISFLLIGLGLFISCDEEESVNKEISSKVELFNEIWGEFDLTYPNFIEKKINWDSVYNVYSSLINENTSEIELSQYIGEMTLSLKDVHVRFTSPYDCFQYSAYDLYDENPPDYSVNYITNVTIVNNYTVLGDKS